MSTIARLVNGLLVLMVTTVSFADSHQHPSNCKMSGKSVNATVSRVIDGDTLLIRTNHNKLLTVRLIGINTPERGNPSFAAQPYYQLAKKSLQQLLTKEDNKLKIIARTSDKHRRLLAHVFTQSGINVQQFLLNKGLAFNLPWPPHLKYQLCYKFAQSKAQKAGHYIWRHPYYQPIKIADLTQATVAAPTKNRSFGRIRGKITSIKQGKKSIWINFASRTIAIRIAQADVQYFGSLLTTLPGKSVIITGYILPNRSKKLSAAPYYMRLRHPHQITELN